MISVQNQNNFNAVFLGQSVLKYEVPLDIYYAINQIYESKYKELRPANKQLVGKIEKEHSLFHEYNPIHIHQGSLATGLSSVMILNLPESFGVEYSASETPQNGRLQILGSSSGQFANIDFQPRTKVRDFFIFPYDVRHCVYPFNGPGWRRTLAANMDVEYDPVTNRGVE